ncbi:MAG: TonB-dependent receptor plug domain-containing protein [Saprospiraceae bacterium]|nr:TonB-dependent receptor plug domain-containing protein [Saprospiraceae bacterium]
MKFIITILLNILFTSLFGQLTIQGTVFDDSSGERLAGATVWEGKNGTFSDEYGRFSFVADRTTKLIRVSYLGYIEDSIRISDVDISNIIIKLKRQILDEITIYSTRPLKDFFGKEHINAQIIQRTPTLLGEKDVIKSIALLPGISGGSEVSSEVFVRGGNGDQNLTLLDGANIFAANHLFGFISPFNPYAIKTADVYKGAFPARYGGRLSSVIDLSLDPGSYTEKGSELTVGLINSYFKNTSPIIKEKFTVTSTARIAYPLALSSLLDNKGSGPETNYYLYDGSIKFSYLPSDKSAISLSIYLNQDIFQSNDTNNDDENKNNISWGNYIGSLQYSKTYQNSGTLKSRFSFSNYHFKASFENIQNKELNARYLSQNNTNEFNLYLEYSRQFGDKFDLNLGSSVIRQWLKPYEISFVDFNSGDRRENEISLNLLDVSPFAAINIKPNKYINVELGSRFQLFKSEGYNPSFQFQPRIKTDFKLSENLITNLSYSVMSQNVQKVTNSSTYIPNDIWLPADNGKTSKSEQISAGLGYQHKSLEFIIEAYYKSMSNLNQIIPNNIILVPDLNDKSGLATNGTGQSKGIEFSIKKKVGRLNGGIYYTLSKSTRNFAAINDGITYPFQFDRRHDFESVVNFSLSEKWSVNGLLVYASGYRITAPDKILYHPGAPNYEYAIVELVRKINNAQFRPYFRTDLSFEKKYKNKYDKNVKWAFGIYNLTGYKNPIYINTDTDNTYNWNRPKIPELLSIQINQNVVTPLRWVPFINYSISI